MANLRVVRCAVAYSLSTSDRSFTHNYTHLAIRDNIVYALKIAYGTAEFRLCQCTNGKKSIKRDAFSIEFDNPLAKLVKKILLEPKKLGEGEYTGRRGS